MGESPDSPSIVRSKKAAELLVKYVLVPALVLLVAYEASQNPDETIALVASTHSMRTSCRSST